MSGAAALPLLVCDCRFDKRSNLRLWAKKKLQNMGCCVDKILQLQHQLQLHFDNWILHGGCYDITNFPDVPHPLQLLLLRCDGRE